MTELLPQDTTYPISKNNDNNEGDASSNASDIPLDASRSTLEKEPLPEIPDPVDLTHNVSGLPMQQPEMNPSAPLTETADFEATVTTSMNEYQQIPKGHEEPTGFLNPKAADMAKDDVAVSPAKQLASHGDADHSAELLENINNTNSEEVPLPSSPNTEAEADGPSATPAEGTDTNTVDSSLGLQDENTKSIDVTSAVKSTTEQEEAQMTGDSEMPKAPESMATAPTNQDDSLLKVDTMPAVHTEPSEQSAILTFLDQGKDDDDAPKMDVTAQHARDEKQAVPADTTDVSEVAVPEIEDTKTKTANTDDSSVSVPEQLTSAASNLEGSPVSSDKTETQKESAIQGNVDESAATKSEGPETPPDKSSEQNGIATAVDETRALNTNISAIVSVNDTESVPEGQGTEDLKNDSFMNVNVAPEVTEPTYVEPEPAVQGEAVESKTAEIHVPMVEPVQATTFEQKPFEGLGAAVASSLQETLEKSGQEQESVLTADSPLETDARQEENPIVPETTSLPEDDIDHVAPLQHATVEAPDNTTPIVTLAEEGKSIEDGETVDATFKFESVNVTSHAEQSDAPNILQETPDLQDLTSAVRAAGILDSGETKLAEKEAIVISNEANQDMSPQETSEPNTAEHESEITPSESLLKQDGVSVDQPSGAVVPESLVVSDVPTQACLLESGAGSIEEPPQQKADVALPLKENLSTHVTLPESSTLATHGNNIIADAQTTTEESSEIKQSVEEHDTQANNAPETEQDDASVRQSIDESHDGNLEDQTTLIEEMPLPQDSQEPRTVSPKVSAEQPEPTKDDNQSTNSDAATSLVDEKLDESIVSESEQLNKQLPTVKDTKNEPEIDHTVVTPSNTDLQVPSESEAPISKQAEDSIPASGPVVEQSVESGSGIVEENIGSFLSGPLVAEPVTQMSNVSSPISNEFATADDSTPGDQTPTALPSEMPDSLLRRVHDRAFSGDSIENISAQNEPMEATPALQSDEQTLLKNDALLPSEESKGSAELIPVPLGQDDPVLITPGIELRPIPRLEPDVIIVSEVSDEDADIQSSNPIVELSEDNAKSMSSLVSKESSVSTVAVDSITLEMRSDEPVHHNIEDHHSPEVTFEPPKGLEGQDTPLQPSSVVLHNVTSQGPLVSPTADTTDAADEAAANEENVKGISLAPELEAAPLAATKSQKEPIDVPGLEVESKSELEKAKALLLSQNITPSEPIEPEAADLTPSAEHPNVVLEIDSTRSDVPEVPSSPRSELGIYTPTFDTRSEISAASHEPLAPSTPRTEAMPSSPIVSEIGEPESGLGLAVETDEVGSEAVSKDSIESIPPSSPVRDFSRVSTPTKGDASIDENPDQPEVRDASIDETPDQPEVRDASIDEKPDQPEEPIKSTELGVTPDNLVSDAQDSRLEDLLKQDAINETTPQDASALENYASPHAAILETPTLRGEAQIVQSEPAKALTTAEPDSSSKEEDKPVPVVNPVENEHHQSPPEAHEISSSHPIDVQELTSSHVSNNLSTTPTELREEKHFASESIDTTADKGVKSLQLKIDDEYPLIAQSKSSVSDSPPTELSQQPFPITDSQPNRSPQIVPLPEDEEDDQDKLQVPSPKTPRSRLLSTASSRLLPGGWKKEYAKPEGRESLEMAQGEFSPPPRDETGKKRPRCNIM